MSVAFGVLLDAATPNALGGRARRPGANAWRAGSGTDGGGKHGGTAGGDAPEPQGRPARPLRRCRGASRRVPPSCVEARYQTAHCGLQALARAADRGLRSPGRGALKTVTGNGCGSCVPVILSRLTSAPPDAYVRSTTLRSALVRTRSECYSGWQGKDPALLGLWSALACPAMPSVRLRI